MSPRRPTVGVAWEAPPTPTHPDWEDLARTLRRNPGKWLKVWEAGRSSWYTAIAIGHIPQLHRDKGFETRTANNTREHPRTCDLYMRYVRPQRKDKADVASSSR